MIENRNVNIINDGDDKKLVLINDIRFKAKVRNDWTAVEEYLKEYIGDFYEIEETSEKYIFHQIFPMNMQVQKAVSPYDDKTGKVARHNIYSASMLVRHANDGRKYLYDILAIKKETSSPLK